MNQALLKEPPRKSVLLDMAGRFNMEPDAFEATVRAQCSPTPKRGEQARPLTREEFAAFLLVARKYDLNPITREIFAYPKRGGGVVPIVSVDGWVNLVNSHPACDGFEFAWVHDEDGNPISCTCTIYRKDRAHPTKVEEFLAECWRDTEPWKMKHRMLRHKALIQCARYAFGFAGIYDEEEGQRIAAAVEETAQAPRPPRPPRPAAHAPANDQERADGHDSGEGTIIEGELADDDAAPPADTAEPPADDSGDGATVISPDDLDDDAFFDELRDRMAEAKDPAQLEEIWTEFDPLARFEGSQKDQDLCQRLKARMLRQLEKEDVK